MGIYQNCYDIIQQYIYGGVELTAPMELTATLVSTIACLFLFTLPFVLVWTAIKAISWGWK